MEEQIDFIKEAGKKNTSDVSPFSGTMISKTVDQLELADHAFVLEIGFKSREYLPFLFQKATGIGYYGNSISETLVLGASSAPALKINGGTAQFNHAKEEGTLDFENNFFGGCFTLNTIYFWKDPVSHLKEIYRVLRIGAKLSLSFVDKKNGAELPWTQADFTFYDIKEVKTFFKKAGFVNIEVTQMTEEVTGQDGKGMVMPFINVVGKK
jgi:SAM-dependent methyltransferase